MKTRLNVKLPFWEWQEGSEGGFYIRWLKKRKWKIEGHSWVQKVRHQLGFISMARKSNKQKEKEVKGAELLHIAASTMSARHQNTYQWPARGPERSHPAATDLCSAILILWLAFIASIQNVTLHLVMRAKTFLKTWWSRTPSVALSPVAGEMEPGDTISRNIWLEDWLRIMGRLDDNCMSPSLKEKLNFKFPRLAGYWSKAAFGNERDDTS